MRAFLDANVLFSAAYMDAGTPRALFLLAKRGERAGDPALLIKHLAVQPEPSPATIAWAASIGLPAKDAPILAAALESRANLLVTGDVAHFGGLFGKRHRGVVVLRPAEAIEIVMG